MPIIYTDEYLKSEVTPEREARATKDVDALGALPADWRDRLIELRCYIVTCQECTTGMEDLFWAKLKSYRAEYDRSLLAAKSAAIPSQALFSAPIGRA